MSDLLDERDQQQHAEADDGNKDAGLGAEAVHIAYPFDPRYDSVQKPERDDVLGACGSFSA
jgi:hypothetical protein